MIYGIVHTDKKHMTTFFIWCILLVLCWPIALVALIIYPLIWLILLPFRIAGLAVEGVLRFIWALFTLPFRVLTNGK